MDIRNTSAALRDRFADDAAVSFAAGADAPGAAVVIAVDTPAGTAQISLQGAQILSWRPPGIEDVLWCSPLAAIGTGKPIRGGVPVCWPWFGPHARDPAKPQHGFARNLVWEIADIAASAGGGRRVHLKLPAGRMPRGQLDGEADVELVIEVGATLSLALTTRNLGPRPLTITEALHTYFRVGDSGAIVIEGLDGTRYRDNADGGCDKTQSGPLRIAAETIAIFEDTDDRTRIVDPVLRRSIAIARHGGRSTIVWNPMQKAAVISDIPPGEERRFVCLESGNVGAAAVMIAPGSEHTLSVVYAVSTA